MSGSIHVEPYIAWPVIGCKSLEQGTGIEHAGGKFTGQDFYLWTQSSIFGDENLNVFLSREKKNRK